MSEEILVSTNCPYCFGYTDASGFHHGWNCPTLTQASVSFIVNPVDSNNEIINLLRTINENLNRIYHEIDTIRLRMK